MKTRTTTALAALMLAGTTLGATAASDTGADRRAATEAKQASKALAKHKADKAVAAAEAAVALAPRNAGYRTLLGQAYLASGRFASAAAALADAVALDPADGGAALHLALAQIATGDWSTARETLSRHEGSIAASDRGLAIALAGDPDTAVAILTQAARTPGADAKTRQNLALSLALAGRWSEARTVAAADVSPAEADARIIQWASFAKPRAAYDQVASLLGVTPVADPGQPVRLALNTVAPTMAAVAQPVAPTAVDVAMPVETAAPATAAEAQADAKPAPVAVTFAPRREIVQAIPAASSPRPSVGRAAAMRVAKPAPVTAVAPRAPARGEFFVQLGAYETAGVARDAWSRLSRRHTALGGFNPQGMQVSAKGATFYRLSVGGFARGDADALCRRVRVGGGRCFVRAGAGDVVAQWARRGVQLASR